MGYPCRRTHRSRVPRTKRREPRILLTMPLRDGTGLRCDDLKPRHHVSSGCLWALLAVARALTRLSSRRIRPGHTRGTPGTPITQRDAGGVP
jgi:hypothetical protein